MYFQYNEEEIKYVKQKCKQFAVVIDTVGRINREVNKDLFSAVIESIIGQQISTKAQQTICKRFKEGLKTIDADAIINAGQEKLQAFGISFKKANYILDFALKVKNGELDLRTIWDKSDEEIIKELTAIKGIGVWTAEMLMLFSMERKNIFSYQDLGIQRGLRMVYHHRKITKSLFEKYRKKFSPYCSIASLYLWEISSGKYEGFKDYSKQ